MKMKMEIQRPFSLVELYYSIPCFTPTDPLFFYRVFAWFSLSPLSSVYLFPRCTSFKSKHLTIQYVFLVDPSFFLLAYLLNLIDFLHSVLILYSLTTHFSLHCRLFIIYFLFRYIFHLRFFFYLHVPIVVSFCLFFYFSFFLFVSHFRFLWQFYLLYFILFSLQPTFTSILMKVFIYKFYVRFSS